jgi:integrase
MPKLTYATPKMSRDHNTAVVYLDGQRHRLGRWGSNEAKENYDRLVAEWLAQGRRLPEPKPQNNEVATVTELAVAFTRHVERRHKANEVSNYKSAIGLARQLYGSEPVDHFGPKALAVVRERMIEGDPEGKLPRKPWSRQHVNKQISRIRAMFKWGIAQEIVDYQTYEKLRTLEPLRKGDAKREGRTNGPVARSQIRQVRPYLSRQVRGLINLQMLTGARADELVRLRPGDIDTKKAVWEYRPEQHKTAHHDKPRLIVFGPRAQKILRQFMRPGQKLDRPIFSPRDAEAERRAAHAQGQRRRKQQATPRQTGRQIRDTYDTYSYRRAIHRACKRAGIEQWSPHRLRHTRGTMIRDRFGPEHAQAVLGHSNLKVTEIYAQVSEQRTREVMQQIG